MEGQASPQMLAFPANLRYIDGTGRGRGFVPDSMVLISAFQSSGDVIADRRADYARQLAEGGEPAAAADLMEQALELVPEWTAGWDLLGGFHEKAGATPQAS